MNKKKSLDFPKFKNTYGVYRAECFRCTDFSLIRADDFYLCNSCGYFADDVKLRMDVGPCTFTEASNIHLGLQDTLVKFIEICHEELFDSENEFALKYLIETRKVDIDTIQKYFIGYVNLKSKKVTNFLRFNYDDFKELKYIQGRDYLGCGNNILFPVFSLIDGKPIGFASRSPISKKFSHSPNNALYNKKKVLYGIPSISSLRSITEAFLVEGMFDVYAMEKVSQSPCYGLIGGKDSQGLIALYRNGIKRLNIASDNDTAGDVIFESISKKWKKHFEIRRFELPLNMDPDEYVNGQ